jgi:hypothetical protein
MRVIRDDAVVAKQICVAGRTVLTRTGFSKPILGLRPWAVNYIYQLRYCLNQDTVWVFCQYGLD